MSGLSQGYLDYVKGERQRAIDEQNSQLVKLQIQQVMQAQQDAARQRAARTAGGAATYGLLDNPPNPAPTPPMPGESSQPMIPPQQPPVSMMQNPQIQMPKPPGGSGMPPYQSLPDKPLPKFTMPAGIQPNGGGIPLPPAINANAQPSAQDHQDMGRKNINIKDIIQTLKRNNVPDEMVLDTLDNMKPMLTEQNMQELTDIKGQLAATKAANDAYKQTIESYKLLQGDKRIENKKEYQDASLEQNQQKIDAYKAKVQDSINSGKVDFNPKTIDLYTEMSANGYNDWRTGISRLKNGQQLILAVDKNLPDYLEGKGMSGMDVVGNVASRKATSSALTQNTKDLAAIRPFKEMLDKNADIAVDLAKKVMSTDSKFANKPLNWIKQNAGDNPDTAEFLAQVAFVQTESARVLNNPRLVGQLTDTAKEEMQHIIDGTMPLNSFERVIRRIQQDGTNRVEAMEKENKSLINSVKNPNNSGSSQSSTPLSFDTEADLNAAVNSGKVKKGDRIIVKGQSGTWQ